MKPRWIIKPEPHEDWVDNLSSSIGYGPLASHILVSRGICDYAQARKYFKPNLGDIYDPFLMKDMRKAVARISLAIENGEKIMIYGDYDVDGTTAVALMYRYLSQIYDKNQLECYIPNRNSEGYGISDEGIRFAKAGGYSLIIVLDCGIKSHDSISYAKSLGIDFIICDHHLPGDSLPDAVAILDPKRSDCRYPFKELSGCGVGFKLCQALNTLYKIPNEKVFELSDLLAISIAADIVSMTDENRVLAKIGLKELRKTKKPGLQALIPEGRLQNFTISNIVFEIAPKINATGRISEGKSSVELMISDSREEAEKIVEQIVNLNDERREIDVNITQSAISQVENSQSADLSTTIVYDPNWNKGVIGIVASRLIENYYRPTLVFTDGNDGELVASARSVSDFDLHKALEASSAYFIKFGGHKAAAGLSMHKELFESFKQHFEALVSRTILPHQKYPSLEIDAEVRLEDLDTDFFNFHRKLAPFGPENMKPILVLRNLKNVDSLRSMGKENTHIKFYLKHNERRLECVGFRLGKYLEKFKTESFDMAFTIEENHWKGNISYYLNIRDVKFLDS